MERKEGKITRFDVGDQIFAGGEVFLVDQSSAHALNILLGCKSHGHYSPTDEVVLRKNGSEFPRFRLVTLEQIFK